MAGPPLVSVVMGSDSDWPVMEAAVTALAEFGVPYEADVVSAHRMPRDMIDYGAAAAGRGLLVIIAGAGGAAHLPGMLAAVTPLPVIGVPVPLAQPGRRGLAAVDRPDARRGPGRDRRGRRGPQRRPAGGAHPRGRRRRTAREMSAFQEELRATAQAKGAALRARLRRRKPELRISGPSWAVTVGQLPSSAVQISPHGRSRIRVSMIAAAPGPRRPSRRWICATSPASPRRRMSAAPIPSSRSRRANAFSCHGADSSTRSVRPNGLRSGRSADRNAIIGSIFQAPVSRASSSTSPARVTAGLGSSRKAPGGPTGTGAPGESVSVWPTAAPPARVVPSSGPRPRAPVRQLAGRRALVWRAAGRLAGLRRCRRRQHGGPPGGRGQRRRPQQRLLQVPADRDELCLPARRDQLARPGREPS